MSLRVAALVSACVLVVSVPSSAQDFGRNKVRYEDFSFQVLQTAHFDIYYYPAEQRATDIAAVLAERWYKKLSAALDHRFAARQPLVLYASQSHFAQTTVVPTTIGESTGGFTDHTRGRVVMPFAAGLRETDRILGHELVHAFQRDILRSKNRSLAVLPLWFVEGMAEYLALGEIDVHTSMWIRDAVHAGRLPKLEELDDPGWFPYRYGQALWAFLCETYGDEIVARSLASTASGGAIGRLTAVTGASRDAITDAWHRYLRDHAARIPSSSTARPVVIRGGRGTRLNVAPAISPDGQHLVFLSERGQYSIDVYLADAHTGDIKRRLISTAADPHFESLQFIVSAGAWDPGGRRFAMAAVRRGRPVMTILDMQSGDTWRELELDVDEAFTPSWSPDGSQLVFSGLRGGLTDLYVLDLETSRTRALTSDPFTELQPAWSPDGTEIAFATDRFTSSLAEATFGEYRLAILTLETRDIRELPAPRGGKAIDPEWSPDGASLYFISDAAGVSNIHRVERAGGTVFKVSDVDTGVSGVTALSPALSIAQSGRLAYSVYRRGVYELHAMDDDGGTPVGRAPAVIADVLRVASSVQEFGNASTPVPSTMFPVKPYAGRLTFDSVGQPFVSAGAGSFGSFITAGMSFSFGDTLGEHAAVVAVQGGSSLHDLAFETAYINRQSRWNWAITADHVPTRFSVADSITGDAGSMTREDAVFRQMHHRVGAAAIYPLDRSRRIEFRAGAHMVGSRRDRLAVASGESLTLGEAGAAFVYDSSVHGPTGPVLGRRFRVDVAPTFGALSLTTVTGDYRRYLMPLRPFTLALRARHVGRLGRSAGDDRLLPLAYDLRDVARGFQSRTIAARACGADASPECAASQYFDTRHVSTTNVELRFPIVGAWRRDAAYDTVPADAFVFTDSAWLMNRSRAGDWSWRALRSAGAGVRVNAYGFVAELAGAHRFSTLTPGWTFAFNLMPAF